MSNHVNPHRNLSMRDALSQLAALGGSHWWNSTGEIIMQHPRWPRRERVNAGRKDATRKVISMLRFLSKNPLDRRTI